MTLESFYSLNFHYHVINPEKVILRGVGRIYRDQPESGRPVDLSGLKDDSASSAKSCNNFVTMILLVQSGGSGDCTQQSKQARYYEQKSKP
jgi:hypothetical protein